MRTLTITCLLLLVLASAAAALAADDLPADIQEVRFTSGRFTLAGSLLSPRSPAPHPVIVYVWGSGPTHIKSHIERSRMLRRFLEKDYAVLLYDKPGSGQSTGELDSRHLFAELAAILLDATALLKARDDIDPGAIGLYGSSQASYVMSVALSQPNDVDFVVAWSCPMQNSIEQSAYLVRNYVLCEGGTQAQADSAQQAYRRRGEAQTYAEYRAAALVLEGIPAIRDGLGWAGVAPEEEFTPPDATSERFLDPGKAVASLAIPVLALYAENDRQIDAVQGAAAYRRILAQSRQELSRVVVIPGADHNMMVSPRGCMQDQPDGYRKIGGAVMSPFFLAVVDDWLGRLEAHRKTGAKAAGKATPAAGNHGAGDHHHGDDATIEHGFEDTDAWAGRFEDPARDTWQLPDSVVATLATRGDMRIADIGSATGYFPVRFARACPDGVVIGADIEPGMVRYLNERAQREGLPNLVSMLASPGDPHLPLLVDLVFICNTYHHINDRVDYFTRLREQLRPGGRVAIVDYRPASRRGPPHKLAPEIVESEMARAGFEIAARHDFLPEQYLLVFRLASHEQE